MLTCVVVVPLFNGILDVTTAEATFRTASHPLPNAPVTQAPNNITHNSATLRWTAPTTGAPFTNYQVEWRCTARGTQTRTVTTTTTAVTGLRPGASTEFRVRAQNAGGWGAWSAWRSFNTTATPVRYSLTVNHYFDGAFSSRLGNTAAARTRINNAHNISRDIMRDIFHLQITHGGTHQFVSLADSCRNSAWNGTCPANCANREFFTNCKDMVNIVQYFHWDFGWGTHRNAQVIWSGHRVSVWGMQDAPSRIWTDPWWTTFMSQRNIFASNNAVAWSNYVLLHELAHQIGAVDHYCLTLHGLVCTTPHCWECNGRGEPPNCIMTGFCNDILNRHNRGENIFCADCRNPNGLIFTNLRNNHR